MTPSEPKDLFSAQTEAGMSQAKPGQGDFFAPKPARLVLELRKIQAPRRMENKGERQKPEDGRKPNFHIPSFKNSKRLVSKDPKGNPLERPFLITSPEYQKWMEKAVLSLESQCISKCQIEGAEIQVVRSKLSAMLLSLPVDDSVNDLQELHVFVRRVNPGEEGATIVIERLA